MLKLIPEVRINNIEPYAFIINANQGLKDERNKSSCDFPEHMNQQSGS